MDPNSIENISQTMKRKGMFLFRDAFMEALDPNFDRRKCLVHVAHAAEILLKARIAQEHPLLIFSKIPKPNPDKTNLTFIDLLENGHTLSYEELPDRLWAATGFKIEGKILEEYKKFGKTRNQIIHTSMASEKILKEQILSYSLEVLDPLVEVFWGYSVIQFIVNDPQCQYFNGEVEYRIKEFLPIDKRLRRLLGEDSKKDCKEFQSELEICADNAHRTDEMWQNLSEPILDPLYADYLDELTEKEGKWRTFLKNF